MTLQLSFSHTRYRFLDWIDFFFLRSVSASGLWQTQIASTPHTSNLFIGLDLFRIKTNESGQLEYSQIWLGPGPPFVPLWQMTII